MLCSKWKAAAVSASLACAGFACVGLLYSQQASSPRPSANGANPAEIVTINEPGKPPQQCVIQKTSRLADGRMAHEVRNLATGEVTTLYLDSSAEGATKSGPMPRTNGKAVVPGPEITQHQPAWGPSTAGAKSYSTPAVNQWAPSQNKSEQIRTIAEPGKQPFKCRVVAEWRTADGQRAAQLQAVDSGDYLTIVEVAQPAGSSNSNAKVTAQLYHWGTSKTPPPGVPVPPAIPHGVAGQGQTWQASAPNAVAMPNGIHPSFSERQKPGLVARFLDGVGGLFSGGNSTTAPMPISVANGSVPQSSVSSTSGYRPATKQTSKTQEGTSTSEKGKSANEGKTATPSTSAAEKSKVLKAPNASLLPKQSTATESQAPVAPQATDAPNPPEGAKPNLLPMLPEAPKENGLVPLPPVPAGTSQTPAPPPSEPMTQWAPGDGKISGVGKPSTDATLPPPIPVPPSGPPTGIATPVLPSLPPSGSMPASMAGAARKNDPLASPEKYLPARIEKETAATPGASQATDLPKLPLGAASVKAATNGGDPRFLPVPMVTVPQAKPPMSPPGPMPAMPIVADTTGFANAFTPAMTPEAQQQAAAMAQWQQRQMMMMQQPGYPMPPAQYGQMMPNYPNMPAPGFAPMGYPGQMQPNMVPAMPNYQMPIMPQGHAMQTAPQGYPMPMYPPGYPMPNMPMQQPGGYANPAMDRPGLPALPGMGGATIQQSMNTLQSSLFPTQREQAVMHLASCDWRANPQVVQLLLTTAKQDPAGMVRAACVTGLARMGASTEAVIAAYQELKNDTDPRVRQEAEQALYRSASKGPITPASGVNR